MLRWRGIDQVLMKDIQSLLQGKAIRLRLQKKSVKNRLEIALRPRRLAGQPVGSPLVDRLSFVFVLGGGGVETFRGVPARRGDRQKNKTKKKPTACGFFITAPPNLFSSSELHFFW